MSTFQGHSVFLSQLQDGDRLEQGPVFACQIVMWNGGRGVSALVLMFTFYPFFSLFHDFSTMFQKCTLNLLSSLGFPPCLLLV